MGNVDFCYLMGLAWGWGWGLSEEQKIKKTHAQTFFSQVKLALSNEKQPALNYTNYFLKNVKYVALNNAI